MNPLHAIDLILAKREGRELSTEQIEFFVRCVVALGEGNATAETITEAQLGSFLMAVFQKDSLSARPPISRARCASPARSSTPNR